MFGPKTDVTVLAARKDLLLAESELNRLRWQQEWGSFQTGVQDLGRRAVSVASLVSTAALAVAGVAALRRTGAKPPPTKRSWLSILGRMVRVGASLWLSYQSRSR